MTAQFGTALECDVLKCGHHGSGTATTPGCSDERPIPTWALISCGNDNSYGHPHAEVMASLEDADVQVYRTDRQGTSDLCKRRKRITLEDENVNERYKIFVSGGGEAFGFAADQD